MPAIRPFVILGALCALSSAAPAQQAVVSLRIVPESAELTGAGASQQILALARTDQGVEVDVTDQADWSIDGPAAIELRDGAHAFSVADGETLVRATFGELAADAKLRVSESSDRRPFSFARDIVGIFTRRGCNGAGCHGGVKGQAGFKLSNNGVHPHEDYKWIVEGGVFHVLTDEPDGSSTPRIDLESPASSLLLRKATMEMSHGGGPRFEKGSDDYRTILAWIEEGAPYGENSAATEPKLLRLEVYPAELTLEPGRARRLLVSARYEDGPHRGFHAQGPLRIRGRRHCERFVEGARRGLRARRDGRDDQGRRA